MLVLILFACHITSLVGHVTIILIHGAIASLR